MSDKSINQIKLMNNISDIISKFENNDIISTTGGCVINEKTLETSEVERILKMHNGHSAINNNELNREPIVFKENYGRQNGSPGKKKRMEYNRFLAIISWLPMSLISVTGTGVLCLLATFILPRAISERILYPGFRLLFGTLYPGYASYKAIRTKNVKEYVSKIYSY